MELLNLVGLNCPMPVIKLKKYLSENKGRAIHVELHLSDRSGLKDMPAFCSQQGLNCILLRQSENEFVFEISNQKLSG